MKPSARLTAAAGLAGLAVAMGIGRFAFTPLLPLMVRTGEITVAQGGWLAAANYVGYFAGALTASRIRWSAPALGAFALALIAVVTAAMAIASMPLWIALRFLGGVGSAWVFVATSVWCLGALARAGASSLAGAVYAGVGTGIALTGLYCLLASSLAQSPQHQWLALGAIAAVFAVPLWRIAHAANEGAPAQAASARSDPPASNTTGIVLCYGVMGFGYILPATYLPVLARSVVDDPRLFGLAWPLFGATAAVSTLAAGWWMRRASRLHVWAVSQFAMAAGVLLPSLWLSGWTIALSALLVGGTFMVITLAGVQEARARGGDNGAQLVGRITAAFALGQIAGPLLSTLVLSLHADEKTALAVALQFAAALLALSAAWLWRRRK